METINISILKSKISEILRHVKAGVDYSILERTTPVAVLTKAADEHSMSVAQLPKNAFGAPKGLSIKTTIDPVSLLLEDRAKR